MQLPFLQSLQMAWPLAYSLICYAIGRLELAALELRLPRWINLGAAVLLGMGSLALQLALYSLLHIPFVGFLLYGPWLLILTGLALLNLRRGGWLWPRFPTKASGWQVSGWVIEGLLLTLLGLVWVWLLAAQVTTPLTSVDGSAIWMYKAKAFYLNGSLNLTDLAAYAHLDYPVAYPLMVAGFYMLGAGLNESLAFGITGLFALAGMSLLYGYARRRLPAPVCAALSLLLVSLSPVFGLIYATDFMGLADFQVGVAFLFFGVSYSLWLETKEDGPTYLGLTLLAGTLAASLKNEGITFLLLGLLAIGLGLFLKRGQWRLYLADRRLWVGLGIMIIAVGGWNLFTRLNGYTTDLAGAFSASRFFEEVPKRSASIAELLGERFRPDGAYLLLGLLPLFSAFALLARPNRRSLLILILLALLIGQAGFYLLIYVVTPLPLEFHINTTWSRLTAQLVPLNLLITSLAFEQWSVVSGQKNSFEF